MSTKPSSWPPWAGAAFVFTGGMFTIGVYIVVTGGRPWFSWLLAVLTMGTGALSSFLKETKLRRLSGERPISG